MREDGVDWLVRTDAAPNVAALFRPRVAPGQGRAGRAQRCLAAGVLAEKLAQAQWAQTGVGRRNH